MKKLEHVIGYKAFNKDLVCRDFQYEIGKKYTHKGDVNLCSNGFHFCEYPLDVFNYYLPSESRYALVDGTYVSDETSDDSKRVSKKLKITAEISLHSLVDAAVKFTLSKVDFNNDKVTNTGYRSASTNTGDRSASTNTGYQSASTNTGYRSASTNTGDQSASTNTGYRSASTNTGDRSASTNTGDQSASTVSGEDSVAIVTGINSKARGAKGCWLVIAEYKETPTEWKLIDIQSIKVDGEKIKADTFYKLIGGKFVEV